MTEVYKFQLKDERVTAKYRNGFGDDITMKSEDKPLDEVYSALAALRGLFVLAVRLPQLDGHVTVTGVEKGYKRGFFYVIYGQVESEGMESLMATNKLRVPYQEGMWEGSKREDFPNFLTQDDLKLLGKAFACAGRYVDGNRATKAEGGR